MSTETPTTDADITRVERRIAAVDQPNAERVLRDVRGQPASASGRDYQRVLFRCPELVAVIEKPTETVYLKRQVSRSAFERATVTDQGVTITDFGIGGASVLLGKTVELRPIEDVDVFETPDEDHRGRGFDGGVSR